MARGMACRMARAMAGIMTRCMTGFDAIGCTTEEFLKIHCVGIYWQGGLVIMVVSVRIILAVHSVTVVIPIPPTVLWIVLAAFAVFPAERFF